MALTDSSTTGAPDPLRGSSTARELPLGVVYLVSLVLVFLGERVIVSIEAARYGLTGLGVLGMLASTGLRAAAVARAPDADRKKAERTLLWLSIGGLIGIGLYFLTTDTMRTALGIAAMSPDKRAKVEGLLTVAWTTAILLSALPLFLGELALAPMRRAERIEARRVRFAIRSGVTLGLAATYCALFTFAAGELDYKLDYSYFRTSKPSESTKNIGKSATEAIEISAFFPTLNDVGAEVEGYLRDVGHGAPNLKIAFYDRLLVPQVAKDKKVNADGQIILSRGQSRESITIGADMKTAATKLKSLDQDFQKALLRVMRESRVAYVTIGHGEINEKDADKESNGRSGKYLKQLLEKANYVVKDLGLTQGLAVDVPNDAGLVMVLGPKEALSPEEVASIGRYADKGGHVLLALDPEGEADHAPLAALVGLTWSPTILANDRDYIPAQHQPSDHAFLVTDKFSSHASVSTLSRSGSQAALIFIRSGSIDKKEGATEKIDFAVKSLPDTYGDTNQNFTFDPDEKKSSYPLAAAITKPSTGGKDASHDGAAGGPEPRAPTSPEMRAFVIADADCLSDLVLRQRQASQIFFYDAVRWLGGEESFAGAITTNEDVKIEHTKQKDVLWFYGTIFGAPLLVGGLGFLVTRRRKRERPPEPPRAPRKKRPKEAPPAEAKKPRAESETEAEKEARP